MNFPSSASAPAPPSSAPHRDWPRRLVNAAVALVVLAVAAATFVLSYAGVHAIALQGGVSVQLARIYPGLFDAVLVIACVAAIMLRDGRWWARGWAWLVVIVVLAAIGTADVLYAADYALRHRTTEAVVAAAPVLAVLLAFSLLLTMLRQSRPQPADTALRGRAARRAAKEQAAAPAAPAPIDVVPFEAVPVVASGAVARPPAPPIALPAAPVAAAAAGAAAVGMATATDEPATVADEDEPVAVADEPAADQAPETAATIADTREMPAFAEDAGQAGQDLPDSAEAPASEETTDAAADPATPDAAMAPDAALVPDVPAAPDDLKAADELEGPGELEASGDSEATRDEEAPGDLAPADGLEASDGMTAPDGMAATDEPNPPAEPDEAVTPEVPTADATGTADPVAEPAEVAEPAPVAEPSPEPEQAMEPGPATEPERAMEPQQAPQSTPPAIRYASSAAAAEDWESEVDPDLAGQVYPVLTSDPDIDTSGYPDEPQAIDDIDAPPFATAPFASVPRLNRMRVSPIPPTDSDGED